MRPVITKTLYLLGLHNLMLEKDLQLIRVLFVYDKTIQGHKGEDKNSLIILCKCIILLSLMLTILFQVR